MLLINIKPLKNMSSGFIFNIKKCKFFVESIEYLERIISQDGIKLSKIKVADLVNSPVPSNIEQVRHFTGLASYCRKLNPNFASRTAFITSLTKNKQNWDWSVAAR